MVARVALLCHAATGATRAAAFPDDEPLDESGRARAQAMSLSLHPARIFTSPTRRAVETARALGMTALPEPLIADLDCGRWAGRSLADIEENEPKHLLQWLSDPATTAHGGECLNDLIARIATWLAAHTDEFGLTLAVTHASVIRAAIVAAIGAPAESFWRIDIAPLSLTRLSYLGGRWNVAAIVPAKSLSHG